MIHTKTSEQISEELDRLGEKENALKNSEVEFRQKLDTEDVLLNEKAFSEISRQLQDCQARLEGLTKLRLKRENQYGIALEKEKRQYIKSKVIEPTEQFCSKSADIMARELPKAIETLVSCAIRQEIALDLISQTKGVCDAAEISCNIVSPLKQIVKTPEAQKFFNNLKIPDLTSGHIIWPEINWGGPAVEIRTHIAEGIHDDMKKEGYIFKIPVNEYDPLTYDEIENLREQVQNSGKRFNSIEDMEEHVQLLVEKQNADRKRQAQASSSPNVRSKYLKPKYVED